MSHQPITGPSVWTAEDLQRDTSWIYTLDPSHAQELAASGPLPTSITVLLDRISAELEEGRGVARLRGLPIDRYRENELRQIFWTIGKHLGTPLYQNRTGEIMGEVRDETHDANPSFQTTDPGKVRSSRARARSTGPLRFHTDRCDVIALFCVRNGIAGGVSKLASIPAIHNEILRRRPDLLDELFTDYWRSRPADEDGAFAEPVFALPVFGMRDGRITSQYSRTYVEQAQEHPSVPRLRPAQHQALDLLAEVAEETCLHAPFEPGDIQFLNNHVVYHGRTAYEDDAAHGQSRLLLRLWLAVPNSRRLPEGFDVLWGAIGPGALRGGVVQADGRRGVA